MLVTLKIIIKKRIFHQRRQGLTGMNTPKYSLQLRCAVDDDRMETEQGITIVGDRLSDVHQRFLVVPGPVYIHRVAVRGIPQMERGGGCHFNKKNSLT